MQLVLFSTLILLIALLNIALSHVLDKQPRNEEEQLELDQQALTGSENAFANLPEKEVLDQLRKLITQHDVDSNGVIDREELEKWIKESFDKIESKQAGKLIARIDEDVDGKISFNEYLHGVHKMEMPKFLSMVDELAEAKDPLKKKEHHMFLRPLLDDREKFTYADEDNDGKLSFDEVKAFLFPYKYSRMAPTEIRRVFVDYDTNKDGKLTFTEFLSYGTDYPEEKKKAEENKFNGFDVNGDGVLTIEDDNVHDWIMPKESTLIETEVVHLLKQSDLDNDEELSLDEILRVGHVWVGHGITHYGDRLKDEF